MNTYWFDLIVDRPITEELTEQLFEAGCDDGTVSAHHDVWQVGFARESVSLEEAIRTARDNVQSVGLTVRQVVIEQADIASTLQETV